MSAHCEKCGQAKWLPDVFKAIDAKLKLARETLAEVIRNSNDILAKKRCSRTLEIIDSDKYEAALVERDEARAEFEDAMDAEHKCGQLLQAERARGAKLVEALKHIEEYSLVYLEKPESIHGAGYSLLGQLAQQAATDARDALAEYESLQSSVNHQPSTPVERKELESSETIRKDPRQGSKDE